MSDYLGVATLDVACLLAGLMMVRAWRRRRTRPPLVAAAFLGFLAVLATALVLAGLPYRIVVGPTFILALFVVLYSARFERRSASGDSVPEARPAPKR
jgi:peptidoglycan/LPS O-acetylase OafA/YrhL